MRPSIDDVLGPATVHDLIRRLECERTLAFEHEGRPPGLDEAAGAWRRHEGTRLTSMLNVGVSAEQLAA